MIAFKIKINKELVATIGQKDMSILTTSLVASKGNLVADYIRLSLSGMSKELDDGFCQHFRWANHDISVGDFIEIELVETETVDTPIKRYRSDSEVQESPFTEKEVHDMRYADYLELKKEFENDTSV